MLVDYVATGKISSDTQLTAALDFLTNISGGDAVDTGAFETACGVGVVVTNDALKMEVEKVLKTHRSGLLEKRLFVCFLGCCRGIVAKKCVVYVLYVDLFNECY